MLPRPPRGREENIGTRCRTSIKRKQMYIISRTVQRDRGLDRGARASWNKRGKKDGDLVRIVSIYIYIYMLSVWEHPFRLIRMKELILVKACQVDVTVSGFVRFNTY